MYWNTIHVYVCDKCKTKFYYDAGDLNDCTISDPEALRCPKCGCIERLEEDIFNESGELDVEDGEYFNLT